MDKTEIDHILVDLDSLAFDAYNAGDEEQFQDIIECATALRLLALFDGGKEIKVKAPETYFRAYR